jgi:hypothetical protein
MHDRTSPRWDAALQEGNVTAGMEAAKVKARSMRMAVDGFEHSIYAHTPKNRARIRESYAPWYYDLHRVERLAKAPERLQSRAYAYHVKTRELADNIAKTNPGSLEQAWSQNENLSGISRDDVAREYMLYKHSLHPIALDECGIQTPDSMFSQRANSGDLLNLDETLRDVFGGLTRSPRAATVSFANTPAHALVRGLTDDSGNMVVGVQPGTSEQVRLENEHVPIEHMSHSILARHHRRERDGFADHFRATDPEPEHAMGMALAHGVLRKPGLNPVADHAPSDYQVHYASRVFNLKPKADPGLFRSHE